MDYSKNYYSYEVCYSFVKFSLLQINGIFFFDYYSIFKFYYSYRYDFIFFFFKVFSSSVFSIFCIGLLIF